jgi:hypothetical protein
VYDGGFEVLQWLPSPSLVPPAQLLKAWCVTVKVLPDISAIWGQFGYRELLYYKGFPGMSTPVFTVSVCTIVKK